MSQIQQYNRQSTISKNASFTYKLPHDFTTMYFGGRSGSKWCTAKHVEQL